MALPHILKGLGSKGRLGAVFFKPPTRSISMIDTADSGECARTLKALGDESRLKIIRLLLNGEKCVSEIVNSLDMAQPQVSHHLSILRGSGLVDTRREGNKVINFIKPRVRFILKKKNIGIDLGCCSIKFDDSVGSTP